MKKLRTIIVIAILLLFSISIIDAGPFDINIERDGKLGIKMESETIFYIPPGPAEYQISIYNYDIENKIVDLYWDTEEYTIYFGNLTLEPNSVKKIPIEIMPKEEGIYDFYFWAMTSGEMVIVGGTLIAI